MAKLLSIILLLPLLIFSYNPGVRFQLAQPALDNFKEDYIPFYIKKISNTTFPSTIVETNLFAFNCTNIKFKSFNLNPNNTQVLLNPKTNTINLVMNNLNFELTAKTQFWFLGQRTGEVAITLTNANLTIPIALTMNQDGTLAAVTQPIIGSLTTLDYQMKTNSYLFSLFQLIGSIWPLNQLSDNLIRKSFVNVAQGLNPSIQKLLTKFKYIEEIGQSEALIDYHMVGLEVNSAYIESDLNGTCFMPGLYNIPLFPAVPPAFQSANTFKIQYTQYFFSSYFWTLQSSGKLDFKIKSEKLPSNLPFTLTTTGLSTVFPNLSRVFGQNVPVDIQCVTFSPPTVAMTTQVYITSKMYCDFLVRQSATTSTAAFRLQFNVNSALGGYLEQDANDGIILIPNLDTSTTSFTQLKALNSNIGTISLNRVQLALNASIYAVSTLINAYLQNQGVKMPIPNGVTITDPNFLVYPGAIEIGATPHFDMILAEIFREDK